MTNWIQTKAGLQMAETLIRVLPKIAVSLKNIDNHNTKMEEIEERLYSGNATIKEYLPKITICLEEIAKNEGGDMFDIKGDSLKLIEEMDIRKQENINLSHRVKELETMLKGYQPEYKDKFDNSILERMSRLETIIEERK